MSKSVSSQVTSPLVDKNALDLSVYLAHFYQQAGLDLSTSHFLSQLQSLQDSEALFQFVWQDSLQTQDDKSIHLASLYGLNQQLQAFEYFTQGQKLHFSHKVACSLYAKAFCTRFFASLANLRLALGVVPEIELQNLCFSLAEDGRPARFMLHKGLRYYTDKGDLNFPEAEQVELVSSTDLDQVLSKLISLSIEVLIQKLKPHSFSKKLVVQAAHFGFLRGIIDLGKQRHCNRYLLEDSCLLAKKWTDQLYPQWSGLNTIATVHLQEYGRSYLHRSQCCMQFTGGKDKCSTCSLSSQEEKMNAQFIELVRSI